MIKKVLFILSLLFYFTFYSCEKSAFLNEGEITEEERLLENYNRIEINDIFNIFLVQDAIPGITIFAGENILSHISTQVKNDTLFIDNTSKFRWSRSYKKTTLFINTHTLLDKITLNAACNLQTVDTISGSNLTIWSIDDLGEIDITINYNFFDFADARTSTGKFTFHGSVNEARMWARGSCHLFADDLVVNNLHIRSSTIGSCFVNATNELLYQIDNTGNIYYTGEPENIIEISVTSSGVLIKN